MSSLVKAAKIVLNYLLARGQIKKAFDFLVGLNLPELEEEKARLAKEVFNNEAPQG